MFRRSENLDEVNALWPLGGSITSLDRSYAFVDDGCLAVFQRLEPGRYGLTYLYADPDYRGAPIKQHVTAGVDWIYTNTDAYIIEGIFELDNLACKALLASVYKKTIEEKNGHYCYISTLAVWADSLGLEAAVAKLRAGNNISKAARLTAAWGAR